MPRVIIEEDTIIPQNPNVIGEQPQVVYVPIASYNTKGIAKFNIDNFTIVDGKVSIKPGQFPSLHDYNRHITEFNTHKAEFNTHKNTKAADTDVHGVQTYVIGEISEHNTSTTAHEDIRTAIDDISGTGGPIDEKINAHNSDAQDNAHPKIREKITTDIAAHDDLSTAHANLHMDITREVAGSIATAIATHNISTDAHSDIRNIITTVKSQAISNITYDGNTGVLTFTPIHGGEDISINLPTESIIYEASYDSVHDEIVFKLIQIDPQTGEHVELRIPIGALIDDITKQLEGLMAKMSKIAVCTAEAEVNNKVVELDRSLGHISTGDVFLVNFTNGINRTQPTTLSVKDTRGFRSYYLTANNNVNISRVNMPSNYIAYLRVNSGDSLMLLNPAMGGSNIDDDIIHTTYTWSSSKTNSEINNAVSRVNSRLKPVITCSSEASATDKNITIPSEAFPLINGDIITVKFTNGNEAETFSFKTSRIVGAGVSVNVYPVSSNIGSSLTTNNTSMKVGPTYLCKFKFIENRFVMMNPKIVDDDVTNDIETWSSNKINSQLALPQHSPLYVDVLQEGIGGYRASKTASEIGAYAVQNNGFVKLRYEDSAIGEDRIYDFKKYDRTNRVAYFSRSNSTAESIDYYNIKVKDDRSIEVEEILHPVNELGLSIVDGLLNITYEEVI